MITDIPVVTISGIDYPIYSLDYSIGGADQPSELSVEFVSDSGDYVEPRLNTATVSKIKVGTFFNFTGFPVSFRKTNSVSGGRSISVKYKDTSIKLDKIFVGLHGVHGISNKRTLRTDNGIAHEIPAPSVTGTFSNIVLLGNYVDPCEGITDSYVDPCDQCPAYEDLNSIRAENDGKKIDCQTEIYTRILDVTYNFQELTEALGSRGIAFTGTPAISTNYYARYTGSARDVLKSWCDEFGLTFYWHNDSIVFVDLKIGININDTSFYNDCNLLGTTEEQSIENNEYSGNIFYFGGEGKIVENDCSAKNDYRLALQPITLKDIFWSYTGDGGETGLNQYISKYYTNKDGSGDYQDQDSIAGLQLACAMSKYSPELRDSVLISEFYGIDEWNNSVVGRKLPLVGIEKVLEVNNYTEEDGEKGSTQGGRSWFAELDPKIRELAVNNKGKLIKVKYNAALHDRFKKFEKELADNFIGRYWISFLSNKDYTFSSPDGSPEYFESGGVPALPFLDLVPESIRGQSVFIRKVLRETQEKNKAEGGGESDDEDQALRVGFVLLDRKAAWEPTENSESIAQYQKGYATTSPFFIEPFKSQTKAETEEALKPDECYILAYNGVRTSVTKSTTYHPTETDNKNLPIEVSGWNSFYGLRASQCAKYHVRSVLTASLEDEDEEHDRHFDLELYMPVQAHNEFGVEFSGYTVIATPKSHKVLTKSLLSKKEIIVGDCPAVVGNNSYGIDNTVATRINWRDLTSSITTIIEATGGACGYNVELIRQVITEFKQNTTRPKSITSITKQYDLDGFPTRELLLSDGVSSLTLRVSPVSGGMKTTVQFNNSPKITRNQSTIDKEVERNIIRRLSHNKPVFSSQKIDI